MITQKPAVLIINEEQDVFKQALGDAYDLVTGMNEAVDVVLLNIEGAEDVDSLKILELYAAKNIPVIVLSHVDQIKLQEECFALGAVDFIARPFVGSLLLARVNVYARISQRIRKIVQDGMIDELTNLPNRKSFEERFSLEWDRAVREARPISVLFMDMDDFKSFNDRYGHTFGDLMIQTSGGIYKRTLKRSTDFVSRWGGDEFVIILPNTNSCGACKIAGRICDEFAGTTIPTVDGVDVSVTVSAGIHSDSPKPGDNPTRFIDKADKALLDAKRSGRNKYCLYGAKCTADCAICGRRARKSTEQ